MKKENHFNMLALISTMLAYSRLWTAPMEIKNFKFSALLLPLASFLVACGSGDNNSKNYSSNSSTYSNSSYSSSYSYSSDSSSSFSSNISYSSSSSSYSAEINSLKSYADFPIGVVVANSDMPEINILTNASEQKIVEKHFSQITSLNMMKAKYVHPFLNTYDFAESDALVDYALSQGLTVHGNALVWDDAELPEFIKSWPDDDPEGFLTMMDEHITTIISHFKNKGNVVSWDVVRRAIHLYENEYDPRWSLPYINVFDYNSVFYKKSGNSAVYIERAFKAARLADPTVDLYYTDYHDYVHNDTPRHIRLLSMLRDFKDRGVPIDGVGLETHLRKRDTISSHMREASVNSLSKQIVAMGYKVKLIALSQENDSLINQCDSFERIVHNYLENVPPHLRGGITVWGVSDANPLPVWEINKKDNTLYFGKWTFDPELKPSIVLFDENYSDKPALKGFAMGLMDNPSGSCNPANPNLSSL